MKKWVKSYLVYVILAVSIIFNAVQFSNYNSLKKNADLLREKLEAQEVTVLIYNDTGELLKTNKEEIEISGISLEQLLISLDEKEKINITIQQSTFGAWLESVESVESIPNHYWAIFSDTNAACMLPIGDPNNYTTYSGYCQKGMSEIIVEYGDVFVLRYLGY
ncbi:hypothetical protein SDC9_162487 [bioreactor metagenome]|uniref:DUF4430 domain-containing protein n=1 Tax=bioreactor metagenome TaxID=1076179 RepID=A0A645FL69_9ZZZZ